MDTFDNRIFERDVLLAAELMTKRTGLSDPERALMRAVLEEAAHCFLTYGTASDRKQRALYEDAREWFASEARTELYDFENVCDVLGIDAGYLRRRLYAEHDRRRVAGASGSATPSVGAL